MEKKSNNLTAVILFGMVAGQALFYFISGKHYHNTATWNVLVVIQFVVAFGAMLWSWRAYRAEQHHKNK